MLKCLALLLTAGVALSAQEDPFLFEAPHPATTTSVAAGAYDQAFSDGSGRWKGWMLEGTIYPASGAPWILSATGFDRPEGRGTLFSAGKFIPAGQHTLLFLALSGGTNTDLLPRFRGDAEVRIGLGSGWRLDFAGALGRFAQSQDVRMAQAGPAYQGRAWTFSARIQQVAYDPGGDSDTGGIFNLRFGNNDFGVWHNLRLAAGRGIIDTTASSGGLASSSITSMAGYGSRFRRFDSSLTTTTTSMMGSATIRTSSSAASPQERLASLTGHWPLTGGLALQAEATWGEKVSTYRFWGGSLQMVMTF